MWALLRELPIYAKLAWPALVAVSSYLGGFVISQPNFNPQTDIGHLSGKVLLVTGANGGIGKETVLQLAKHSPSRIFLGARNGKKAQEAIADIKKNVPDAELSFVRLDLTSFESIVKAAKQIRQECSRLDILILNAGIMATPYGLTQDKYEMQLGTNHIGHALLTRLLLPLMNSTAALPDSDVRIVSVSSIGHHMAPHGGILFDQEAMKELTPAQLYGQSKLANILYVKALAKRYPKITAIAVHPGVINTELYGPVQKDIPLVGLVIQTVGALVLADVQWGALNQLWAATASKALVKSGMYYMPVGKGIGTSKHAEDAELADQLWTWTERQFAERGIVDNKKEV